MHQGMFGGICMPLLRQWTRCSLSGHGYHQRPNIRFAPRSPFTNWSLPPLRVTWSLFSLHVHFLAATSQTSAVFSVDICLSSGVMRLCNGLPLTNPIAACFWQFWFVVQWPSKTKNIAEHEFDLYVLSKWCTLYQSNKYFEHINRYSVCFILELIDVLVILIAVCNKKRWWSC